VAGRAIHARARQEQRIALLDPAAHIILWMKQTVGVEASPAT